MSDEYDYRANLLDSLINGKLKTYKTLEALLASNGDAGMIRVQVEMDEHNMPIIKALAAQQAAGNSTAKILAQGNSKSNFGTGIP